MNRSEDSRGEWGSDLGLFLSGLFNFYQFAAFEVKDQFLNIIDQYILSFDKELLLSLPGFMICMLPALEDQNAEKLKKVEEILKKTEQNVGTSEFYGEIWKAMLRTNRTRLSAIKYLEKRIPRDLDAARELGKKDQIYISKYKIKVAPYRLKDGSFETRVVLDKDAIREEEERKKLELKSLEDYFYFYYPMKEKLCINSLLAGLGDTSSYVNRGVLDFLISHAPITGRVNSDLENIKLVEGALSVLIKKDFAFLKKFFTWVLGHLDDDDDYRPKETDPAIKTLVPALKCLYKKFLDKQELARIVASQKDKAPHTQQAPHNIPILITQTLLNDNNVIIEPILLQISVDLIKYIKHYIHDKKDSKNRFFDNVKNLFDMVPNQLRSIWTALGELLSKEINENKVENTYQVQAIELIDFCLRDLKQCFDKQVGSETNLSDYLRPILSSLLSGVNKLSNSMKNLENIIPALDLIQNIIGVLDLKGQTNSSSQLSLLSQQQEEYIVDLQASVSNFNSFYVELCNVMTSSGGSHNSGDISDMSHFMIRDENFKLKLDTFKKASQILTQIQEFSSTQQLGQTQTMPAWLASVVNCSKTRRAKIALIATETFLNILSKETRTSDPVRRLQILLVRQSSQAANLDPGRNIYLALQETRNHHCTDIIKNLWSLLDEEEDHFKIVILLKKFDGLLPAIFSEVVINDLVDKAPREVKERGLKKFSIFWNLTAFDYPNYRPFYEKDTTDRRYGALHNVLHFLEQHDPTLRLSCKSWLSESKNSYNRILDPLIEEFLQNSKVFVTFTRQIFFYDMYDTKIVSENFGKLRNIILNTQDEMINYMINKSSSEHIQKEFDEMFDWMLPHHTHQNHHSKRGKYKYLEIVVYITLQFIMGQAVQSVDHVLYQESQTVNASACEFMELILKSLETHPEVSNRIAHIIVDPILRTFKQVIENQNHAMQVHLLNLLKVIFFQCNFCNVPESKDNCERILRDPSLIDSLIKGMKNEVSFVRYHFIQFSTNIMETMKKLLKAADFTRHVTKLIACFCELMQHVDVTHFATQYQSLTTNEEPSNAAAGLMRRTTIAPTNQSQRSSVSGVQQQQKVLGQLVINQESDIAQLIQGFKKILSDALSIYIDGGGSLPSTFMNSAVDPTSLESQYKQAEGTSLLGKVSKLFGGGGDGPLLSVNTDEQVIRDAIYFEFKKIIVSCLHCWNHLPIFIPREFHFTRSGVYPYTSQDDNMMNQQMERAYERFKEDKGTSTTRDTIPVQQMQQQQQLQTGLPYFSIADYIKMQTNPIQRYVLDFLRPLTDTSSNQMIEGALMVWMDKKNLDSSANLHHSLEKLMQLLQSIKIKHYHVVECLNHQIDKQKWKTLPPKSKKKVVLEKVDVQRETLLCQFLYTYLLYNCQQMFSTKGAAASGEEQALTKLYKAVLKFVQAFKESRHAPTLCWLLEILHILSIKFSPMDAYRGDAKLKKDFYDTLNDLLQSTSLIINEGYKVQFEKGYGFLVAFPPQVYEMLRRFSPKLAEYTSYAQASVQKQVKKVETNGGGSATKGGVTSVKRNGGMMQQQQMQPKMQPLQMHNPPEDVEDEEEMLRNEGGTSSRESYGIGFSYGLKLGREQGLSNQSSFFTQSSLSTSAATLEAANDFSDYANSDYFFEEGTSSTSKFLVTLSSYINYPQQECPDYLLLQYHRFFTIVTLKGCLFSMVHSIVGGNASHTAFDKIQASLKLIVDEVLKLLGNRPSTLTTKEDSPVSAEKEKAFLRETVTDFFASLMDGANMYLVKRYKQEISDLFFHDNFFQMSRRNLRKWCKIINHFISDHKDAVFDDLLYKWNTQAGLLTSKETENKQKVIALKRVSFLVFSGNVDQYDDKLDLLLKKMTEGLKSSKKSKELQTQLFLLTRVLLLRLQTTTLTEALRKLWPHLLNELESIFRPTTTSSNPKEEINLLFEAIKVIELMSALNIEDFQMNQWIFLIDGYGMKHEVDQTSIAAQSAIPRKAPAQGDHDFQVLDKNDAAQPGGIFQPYILRFMQNSLSTFYDQKTIYPSVTPEEYVRSNARQVEQRKSSIQIDKHDYDKDQVLETFALGLQMTLNELNTERTEIDKANFEALIEKDFIEIEITK